MVYNEDVTIVIPDLLRSWPWPRRIHPDYDAIKAESANWWNSLEVMNAHMRHVLEKTDPTLLGGRVYSSLDKEACRIGCDYMGVLFAIEEETDTLGVAAAQRYTEMIMDVLHHPHVPNLTEGWIGGEITRRFWGNVVRVAPPAAQEHFIDVIQGWLEAVIEEASGRTNGRIYDLDSYVQLRRRTVGTIPSFAVGRVHSNIASQEVWGHPVIVRLTELATDMVILSNDIYSYKKERERGEDTTNMITVAMNQFSFDIQSAIDWITGLHASLVEDFVDQWHRIPTYGSPVDTDVRGYCDTLRDWVRGNETWSMECGRYFGEEAAEVDRTRVVCIPGKLQDISRFAREYEGYSHPAVI